MTYTIKEIALAWTKFTQPKWIVEKNNEANLDEIQKQIDQKIIMSKDSIKTLPIDYSRWIPYLISEEWKD